MEIKHEKINSYGFKVTEEGNRNYYYLIVSNRLKLILYEEVMSDEHLLFLILERCKFYLPIEVKYGVNYRELSNTLSIAYSKNNDEMIQKAKHNLNELKCKIESEFGELDRYFGSHMV